MKKAMSYIDNDTEFSQSVKKAQNNNIQKIMKSMYRCEVMDKSNNSRRSMDGFLLIKRML